VEQLTQWVLIQARHRNNIKARELTERLSQQFDEIKRQVWDLHSEATGNAVSDKSMVMDSKSNSHPGITSQSQPFASMDPDLLPCTTSAMNPNHREGAVCRDAIPAPNEPVLKNTPTQLFIEVVHGPYQGATFVLKPELRKPCFIGRSSGKKFRTNGISMPKNPEVSTTHGKVEIKMDGNGQVQFYYTDTGSTNGTLYNDQEMEDNVPLELFHGIELVVGGSLLRFTFLYE
jgi:pSer/pThr/pTyr-binding forkhead associated (FHA) protein